MAKLFINNINKDSNKDINKDSNKDINKVSNKDSNKDIRIVLAEWEKPKNILIILAHPDDPEFFCGATSAYWTEQNHHVSYCILTNGDKGGDCQIPAMIRVQNRKAEQVSAARILGITDVVFLEYPDGYLVPDLELRKAVVRIIRQKQADILVTSDPTNYFPRTGYINHPDHRAAGQAVMDAVFPAAGNPLFFPEIIAEGFSPHMPQELWLALPSEPDTIFDVTEWWGKKLRALYEHHSQIGDKQAFDERMMRRRTKDSTIENPRYEEKFRRIKFS